MIQAGARCFYTSESLRKLGIFRWFAVVSKIRPFLKDFILDTKGRFTPKNNFPAESRIYVFLKKKVLTNSVGDDKIICVAKR